MTSYTLNNGLRVVFQPVPYIRSVSVGVWVRAGSMLENATTNGLAHFVEHMAFEGTYSRTAKQLAEEMDFLGGHVNAATGKLSTNYYLRVLDEHLELALDILSDIVIHPRYADAVVEKEKGVILEEIAMVEDSPEDVAFDLLARAVYGEQSLGQTVAGEPEQIRAYRTADIKAFHDAFYTPENSVVVVAGHFDEMFARDLIERWFGIWQGHGRASYPLTIAVDAPRVLRKSKNTEQLHLCIGYRSIPLDSPEVYRLSVMNSILGGSASSRLFQRIREEMGMAYAVDTCPYYYPGCGEFTVYAATAPHNAGKVLEEIDREMVRLLQDGVDEREFLQAKAQLKSSYALGLESAFSQMQNMGSQMIVSDRMITLEEHIRGIDGVTIEQVMQSVEEIVRAPRSIAVVGKGISRHLPGIG